MKSLESILQKREELRQKSKEQMEKVKFLRDKGWSNLNEEEKKELNDSWNIVRMLEVQIDALTYVINYDSELRDVTAPRQMISSRN